jgi:DNA-binding MarR family transcriptional regulator
MCRCGVHLLWVHSAADQTGVTTMSNEAQGTSQVQGARYLPLKKTNNTEQQAAIKVLLNAHKPFRNLREHMPLQYVTSFLLVAAEEDLNVSEYAKRAGVSQSLMTRHLADLGSVNRHHEEGLGLVEAYGDLMDRRNRLIRLTARGKHVPRQSDQAQ